MGKKKVPAVEGMFTIDPASPALIGGRSKTSGSYYFPMDLAGNDPEAAPNEDREEVALTRHGKVWSYTSADYPPALPYLITEEPFKPFVIAAVELEKESMVICGLDDAAEFRISVYAGRNGSSSRFRCFV